MKSTRWRRIAKLQVQELDPIHRKRLQNWTQARKDLFHWIGWGSVKITTREVATVIMSIYQHQKWEERSITIHGVVKYSDAGNDFEGVSGKPEKPDLWVPDDTPKEAVTVPDVPTQDRSLLLQHVQPEKPAVSLSKGLKKFAGALKDMFGRGMMRGNQ